ncbi:hypothetical protein Tco_0995489 [Tanacetum coccineum]
MDEATRTKPKDVGGGREKDPHTTPRHVLVATSDSVSRRTYAAVLSWLLDVTRSADDIPHTIYYAIALHDIGVLDWALAKAD